MTAPAPATDDPPLDITDWLRAVVDEEARETPPLLAQTTFEPTCYPHTFAVDEVARKVTCSRCKREFLAFDALLYLSREWVRYAFNLATLKREMASLRAQQTDLKRRVRNLRARAQRAEAPPPADGPPPPPRARRRRVATPTGGTP